MLMRPPAPPKPSMTNENATRQHHRIVPGQRPDPAEQAPAAAQARRDLDRRADREHRQQRRQRHQRGEGRMDELEAGADLRIGEGVVHADRHRDDQEQDEGDPRHACRCRAGRRSRAARSCNRRCRSASARNRRWRAASRRRTRAASPASIVVLQPERDRNDLQQQFERGADRGPGPEIGARDVGEHRQRHRRAGMARFQTRRLIDISATQIQEPTTTSTTPR